MIRSIETRGIRIKLKYPILMIQENAAVSDEEKAEMMVKVHTEIHAYNKSEFGKQMKGN